MNLMYHSDWRGNFGDDLNIPFFEKILPNYRNLLPEKKLYGIGTLLNDVHGKIKDAVIFGSGFGYGDNVSIDWKTSHVFGVRGPVTARKLGLSEDLAIGDPAMYVGEIPELMVGKKFGYKKVVALHHKSTEFWDFNTNNDTDLYFLDPGLTSIPDYISIIRGADIVYTESLHGAIIAATFGVPFFPISIHTKLEPQKWADFYALLGRHNFKYETAPCPSISFFRRLMVSSKARKLFTPPKIGGEISSSYFQQFKDVIDLNGNQKKCIVSESHTVKGIKLKISQAISEIQHYTYKESGKFH